VESDEEVEGRRDRDCSRTTWCSARTSGSRAGESCSWAQEDTHFKAGLNQAESQFSRTLAQQQSEFDRSLGFQEKQFDWTKNMDMQHLQLDKDKLAQEDSWFQQNLSFQKDQFDWTKQMDLKDFGLRTDQFKFDKSMQTSYLDLAQAEDQRKEEAFGFEQEQWDWARKGWGLQSAQIDAAKELLPQQTKVLGSFYERALESTDDRGEVMAAQAQAAQAASIAEGAARRDAARMGMNVENMDAVLKNNMADRAKLSIGATQLAKQQVANDSFNKLSAAANIKLGVG
jgi:hypothetical protein